MGRIHTPFSVSVSIARRQQRQQPLGALSRLDSRLQRWRAGLLELQHRGSIHRMACPGRDRGSRRRQARMGCGQNSDKANEMVKPIFRKGWEISLT
jgi:hypothetical protein